MIITSCHFQCYFYIWMVIFFWVWWMKVTILLFPGCHFPPCIGVFLLLFFVGLRLYKISCVNLVLSWNILVSPSLVIESFAGYNSLGWYLCSLRVCMRSSQDLIAFMFSGEKSGVILIGLPLYVTWPFSLTAFNILSLFSIFRFWLLCDGRYFCSGPVCLEFCRLLVYSWASLSLG